MKKILLIPILFLNSLFIYSQAPTIEWRMSFGGSLADEANSIQQTTDGGYIIVGTSTSFDGDVSSSRFGGDMWVVKLDSVGIMQWQKSLGSSYADYGYSVQQTIDGGYIVAGASSRNDGDVTDNNGGCDCWIVKLDNSGAIEWQKSYGLGGLEFGYSIQQTVDSGYIVAAEQGEDYWILKLDNSGVIQWQKVFGGSGEDKPGSIQQTADGGYIIAGYSFSTDGDVTGNHGYSDYWIVKLDNSGNLQWEKSLGGSYDDYGYSIQQTADGGYIIAGSSNSTDGDVLNSSGGNDMWIIKLNNLGTIQWQKSLQGSTGFSIQKTADGGYVVAGVGHTVTSFEDYLIVKLNNLGTIEWQKLLGGTDNDCAYSVQQTADGGYIIAGYSWSSDGDVTDNYGYTDYWIVKLGKGGTGINENLTAQSINVSPNPSKDKFNFYGLENENQIEVYDLTGKLILQSFTKNNSYAIDLSDKNNGIYFYKIIGNNNIYSGKLLKQ